MTSMCNVILLYKCCAPVGYHAACDGNSLPTCRYNRFVLSLRVGISLLRNIPEERRSHILCGGSRK